MHIHEKKNDQLWCTVWTYMAKEFFFNLLYKQGLVKHNTVVTHGIEDENMNDLEHERMGELLWGCRNY